MNLEGRPGSERSGDGIVTVELRFDSMRQFQAEFSPNLSSDGVFIPYPSPFPPSTVVRFTVTLPDEFRLLEGVGVVLWAREEEVGSGQPAGMALRFASLGPRSQELIDSLVDAFVAEGGSPFELESFGEGDEFIPTDALAGRTAMPERRPLPSLGDRVPEDDRPWLKVRGVVDDLPLPRVAPAGLDDEVTAVTAREVSARPAAATAPHPEVDLPVAVSESATEELWRDGLGAIAEPRDGAGGLAAVGSDTPPSGPESPGSGWDLTLPSGAEIEEVDVTVEPERTLPPQRTATRPERPVETARELVAPTAGSDEKATAGELVAEVIASEENRTRGTGSQEEDTRAGESDEAVDSFADSLRRLDQPRTPVQVGAMPEVTILPRDEEEEEQQERPTRRVPWGALAAVAVVLVVALAGYLLREPIARLLVPESPGPGPVAVNRSAGGPGIAFPTRTQAPLVVASVATPTAPAVEPTPAVEPSPALEPTPTPPPVPPPVEPTEVPPAPTAAPTPSRPPTGSAGRVEDLRWSSDGGRTVVTIVTDGTLAEDRVRVGTMSDPPRVLVRLIRVDRFRRFEVPVGTGELDRIRIGHHPEQNPPSLHLVLDVTGTDVRLVSTEVEGAEVRLTLSR